MNELLSSTPWFKDVVPDFRVLPSEELPAGIDSATAFTSVCINTSIYLPYLVSQCLKNNVVVKRGIINHILEAAKLHHSGKKADVVVNCTGLLASKLGGVMDKEVIPARGQIVLVRNEPGVMSTISGTDDGDDEVCYIMQRAAGTYSSTSFSTHKTNTVHRWWYYSRRHLSKGQLGVPARPQPSDSHYETGSRDLSRVDWR